MKIYLDVSCLNRPFDDQGQARIRLEAEAIALILDQCELGTWQHVSSEMATIEVSAMPDTDRRARVQLLLPEAEATLELTPEVVARARSLEALGFKSADALHVAAAEAHAASVMFSCDDRLCRLARRREAQLRVKVANPVDWLKEIPDDADPR